MKIRPSTPKRLRIFKGATFLVGLLPIIDLGTLILTGPTPAEDPRKAVVGSLFIIAGGFVVVWARRHFQAGSVEHRSLPVAGLGCVALGLARLTAISPGVTLIRIIVDCVAVVLFLLAFIRISKG